MTSKDIMTQEELNQYFSRLHIEPVIQPDLETLRTLQFHHLCNIPYENLDSLSGKITSLEHADLFQKIITQRRGGICFELNGLYAWLLESLGYQIRNHAARFISREEEVQMRRHRVMTVTIDQKRYLTDVGVNCESPRFPLLLEENLIQSDGISEYQFTKDSFWGWILWQKLAGKEWRRMYGFTEEPQLDLDYVMACVFCDVHILSPVNKFPKISIFTDQENLRIWNDSFQCFRGGRVVEEYKIPENKMNEFLIRYFSILIRK